MFWISIPADDFRKINDVDFSSADELAPLVTGSWKLSPDYQELEGVVASSPARSVAISLRLIANHGGASLSEVHEAPQLTQAVVSPVSDAEVIAEVNDVIALRRGTFGVIRDAFDSLLENLLAPLRQKMEENSEYRRELSDYIVSLKNPDFPWSILRPKKRGLAFLYNFSPFADTGAVVASKRLRQRAESVDVIACSYLNRKKVDTTIENIAVPYVARTAFLDLAPSWASWEPFRLFVKRALEQAQKWENENGPYEFLYTRAMWAPSHFAGVRYKLDHPDIPWTAEFSDPLSLDVQGLPRGGEIPIDDFLTPILEEVENKFGKIPDSYKTIFSLAEIVAYAFADTIMFTNDFQMQTMLEHVYSNELRERIVQHAVVSNHPTLPPMFYSLDSVDYPVDRTKINLAYFGEFYATRGITDVTSALRSLPDHLRTVFNLHVFTTYIPSKGDGKKPHGMSRRAYEDLVKRALDGVGAEGIEDQVFLNGALPYLKFLGITHAFDYLIVNDALSGEHHSCNPYLPSKWSDYAGSTANSWAFVEKGSSLSKKPATIHSPVGDAYAARNILWDLAEKKLEELDREGSQKW